LVVGRSARGTAAIDGRVDLDGPSRFEPLVPAVGARRSERSDSCVAEVDSGDAGPRPCRRPWTLERQLPRRPAFSRLTPCHLGEGKRRSAAGGGRFGGMPAHGRGPSAPPCLRHRAAGPPGPRVALGAVGPRTPPGRRRAGSHAGGGGAFFYFSGRPTGSSRRRVAPPRPQAAAGLIGVGRLGVGRRRARGVVVVGLVGHSVLVGGEGGVVSVRVAVALAVRTRPASGGDG